MFSYEIYKNNDLVASGGDYVNYTAMCIEVGGIIQQLKTSDEPNIRFVPKMYENGKLLGN